MVTTKSVNSRQISVVEKVEEFMDVMVEIITHGLGGRRRRLGNKKTWNLGPPRASYWCRSQLSKYCMFLQVRMIDDDCTWIYPVWEVGTIWYLIFMLSSPSNHHQ